MSIRRVGLRLFICILRARRKRVTRYELPIITQNESECHQYSPNVPGSPPFAQNRSSENESRQNRRRKFTGAGYGVPLSTFQSLDDGADFILSRIPPIPTVRKAGRGGVRNFASPFSLQFKCQRTRGQGAMVESKAKNSLNDNSCFRADPRVWVWKGVFR